MSSESTGRIHFAGFYRRRVARRFPAYLFMLAIAIPLMVGPLRGVGTMAWPEAVASTAVYLANWAQASDVNHLGPLMHTWSLSVEEQFYLIWPVCFVALTRRVRRPARWVAAGVTLVVVGRAVGWTVHPGLWPYFATFTHCDGLLLGALLAILMAPRNQRVAGHPPSHRAGDARTVFGRLAGDRFAALLAWVAAAGLAIAMLLLRIEDAANFYVGLTLSAVASAIIVRHLLISPRSMMVRLLSLRPLAAIGRVSYGLYLYHMPIFVLVQIHHPNMATTLLLEVRATVAVTVFSWFVVEQPVQRWAARRWPRTNPAERSVPAAAPVMADAHVGAGVPAVDDQPAFGGALAFGRGAPVLGQGATAARGSRSAIGEQEAILPRLLGEPEADRGPAGIGHQSAVAPPEHPQPPGRSTVPQVA